MGYFANAGMLLVNALFGILLAIVVLRVLLQATRANFYNPICQLLYKATNPVLMPLQKVVPNWRNWNLGGVIVAWLLAIVWIFAITALSGLAPNPLGAVVLGLAKLVDFVLVMLFWIILIRVILSFVSSDFDNPVVPLLYKISDPVLKPFQRFLPRPGGIDFSPLVATLAIYIARALIVAPLYDAGMRLAT